MDEEHIKDLKDIEEFISGNLRPKYTKGVEEHGGLIWKKSVPFFMKEARDEITDLAVYLHHLSRKVETMHDMIEKWGKEGKIDKEMWQEFSTLYDGTVHTD